MFARYFKWVGFAAVVLLIVSCFTPWVTIPARHIVVSGVDSTGTNFGKPGYLHFVMSFFFIVFMLVPRVWAKRSNLLVGAINMAWAIRNFIFIPACIAGECPLRETGIYLALLASVLMLLATLFPDMKLPATKK